MSLEYHDTEELRAVVEALVRSKRVKVFLEKAGPPDPSVQLRVTALRHGTDDRRAGSIDGTDPWYICDAIILPLGRYRVQYRIEEDERGRYVTILGV